MQTIGCLVNDGEELTNYFGTLEKMPKPVNESIGHLIWTRVRPPPGPQTARPGLAVFSFSVNKNYLTRHVYKIYK